MIDFKLQQLENGSFDLIIDKNGVIETTKGFDTSMLVSLFTNGNNPNAVTTEQTQGFWFNQYLPQGFTYGNLAYLYDKRLGNNYTTLYASQLQSALQWLSKNNYASNVSVKSTADKTNGVLKTNIAIQPIMTIGSKITSAWNNTTLLLNENSNINIGASN